MYDRLNFSIASTPNGIEQQEAQGQRNLVQSQTLPKKSKHWETLKRWGVKILKEADALFYFVELPQGWSKQATDHSMWSKLVDDRGLKRASIFYKASFHDLDASISAFSRFHMRSDYKCNDGHKFEVYDGALERTIRRFQGGQYAVLNSDPSVVGFTLGDRFHYAAEGSYSSDSRFTKSCEATAATLISDDEFYRRFHHVKACHEVIDAAEKLARVEADAFLETLPNDDRAWDAEFDFPAVEG